MASNCLGLTCFQFFHAIYYSFGSCNQTFRPPFVQAFGNLDRDGNGKVRMTGPSIRNDRVEPSTGTCDMTSSPARTSSAKRYIDIDVE